MGGSNTRMEKFTKKVAQQLGVKIPLGCGIQDLCVTDRYSMFKAGPMLAVSVCWLTPFIEFSTSGSVAFPFARGAAVFSLYSLTLEPTEVISKLWKTNHLFQSFPLVLLSSSGLSVLGYCGL